MGDVDTPVSLYLRLKPGKMSFLLESVETGEHVGRYSFLGIDPHIVLIARGPRVVVGGPGGRKVIPGNPMDALRRVWLKFCLPVGESWPPFIGGLVGYIGYDAVRWIEKIPSLAPQGLPVPDIFMTLNRFNVIYDHLKRTITAVYLSPAGWGGETYEAAQARLDEFCHRLTYVHGGGEIGGRGCATPDISPHPVVVGGADHSDFRRDFVSRVRRAKEYIYAGDILQVVLSQRLEKPHQGDPFFAYRHLRSLNPSPYMFYLHLGSVKLAGSSPEMLVRVRSGQVENCPIAGTRPRGRTPVEDSLLEKSLLASEKERAEHVMLIDLARNDVGRVAEVGSVRVAEFMKVERYSHVMHLVSRVTGRLADNKDALDALWSCFPAGTVSGAPKKRAMEIIEELEPCRRGPYAGVVGYLGLNGELDTCITIRTILFHRGVGYVQAGAGIVADSDPEAEYEEVLNKAQALLEVLGREEMRRACLEEQ